MRPFPEEAFRPAAAPRHARLFELIRQDNLIQGSPSGVLSETRTLAAVDSFRAMACRSLQRAP